MSILGIDPGPSQSAYMVWDNNKIVSCGIEENPHLLHLLRNYYLPLWENGELVAATEMIESMGMPVGKQVFETVLIVGRIVEIFSGNINLVYRREIKLHFCNSMKARDSNIRQALIDRFGEPGTKKKPGLLYGVSYDIWSALAICVYGQDTKLG